MVTLQSMLAVSYSSEHMAHSVRRRTLKNMTEMTFLVCILILLVLQYKLVQLRASNTASMKAQGVHTAPALHTHNFCATSALLAHPV